MEMFLRLQNSCSIYASDALEFEATVNARIIEFLPQIFPNTNSMERNRMMQILNSREHRTSRKNVYELYIEYEKIRMLGYLNSQLPLI